MSDTRMIDVEYNPLARLCYTIKFNGTKHRMGDPRKVLKFIDDLMSRGYGIHPDLYYKIKAEARDRDYFGL